MSTYIVKVSANIPYPWGTEYRIEAGTLHTAFARGVRNFRKEERMRGKRLTALTASAYKI